MKKAVAIAATILGLASSSTAFTTSLTASPSSFLSGRRTLSSQAAPLHAQEISNDDNDDDNNSSRRTFLAGAFTSALTVGAAAVARPPAAHATYSAYAHREEDWQARQKNNQVQYSSAKQLRSQLAEIAPMNVERSQIFCPNGPSAAVSPLMENKCGDRAATPSVYGRTEDAVGNSIPGFAEGYSFAAGVSMPEYGFTTGRKK